ncbi:unnamed protein product [Psylliodes chrysocephalus]|uniref:LisH domain-containing protein n=1 Tax=Psylliodes chrysocephalus TaxID=3402493 RepID=A0A9P0CS63_9CUCU|nr:unnamed protein product [Psylliodes chrysocephala]
MDNIEAAIPMLSPSTNISSQEFQSLLTSWYEEKGILSQLRAQLRFKMINVLKNTAIGRDITKKTSQTSISLSKQAINLIVAEFLMKNNFDYSLSIFNTEAGLSSMYIDNLVNESGKQSLHFDKENIVNILELIGINKTTYLCEDILNIYYDNDENIPLLSCLINMLSIPIEPNEEPPDLKPKTYIDLRHETDFIREVGTVLLDSHISIDKVICVIEIIKNLHNKEIKRLEDNCTKTVEKLKNVLSTKDKQIEHMEKKKRMAEIKLLKIIGDYNSLKHHMKNVIKDRLLKEQEIKNLKNKSKTDDSKPEKNSDICCNLDHCDNTCKENKQMLIQLQSDNQELYKKNAEQKEEITDLQKKYNELLHDFHFLQKKVSLLNLKVNEDRPVSHLNLNTKEIDIKYPNKEHSYKQMEITDSSDSITEEVIRQAWLRLEQLEKESKEIEEQYKL